MKRFVRKRQAKSHVVDIKQPLAQNALKEIRNLLPSDDLLERCLIRSFFTFNSNLYRNHFYTQLHLYLDSDGGGKFLVSKEMVHLGVMEIVYG